MAKEKYPLPASRTNKFQLSYRHGSGVIYAADITQWNGFKKRKIISLKFKPGRSEDIDIMQSIHHLLSEGDLEIHDIPTTRKFGTNKT